MEVEVMVARGGGWVLERGWWRVMNGSCKAWSDQWGNGGIGMETLGGFRRRRYRGERRL